MRRIWIAAALLTCVSLPALAEGDAVERLMLFIECNGQGGPTALCTPEVREAFRVMDRTCKSAPDPDACEDEFWAGRSAYLRRHPGPAGPDLPTVIRGGGR